MLTQDTEDWGQGEKGSSLAQEMTKMDQKWMWIETLIHRNNLFLPRYSSEYIHVDLKQRAKDRGVLIKHEQPSLLLYGYVSWGINETSKPLRFYHL